VEVSPFVIKVTKSVLLIDSTNGYIAHVPTGTFILSLFENICASLWRNEFKCSHLCVTILVAKEETEIMEPALFRLLFNEDLSKWLSIMHHVPNT
jgi:hypothetical protein